MKILGINISHDASSCLMIDGKIIYYFEEERLSKIKHNLFEDNNNKFYGIEKLKKYSIEELDCVSFSSYRRHFDSEDKLIIDTILKQISEANIKINKVYYNKEEHHLYHIYNAFYNSKFKEATIIICDGQGAYTDKFSEFRELETIYYADQNNFNLIYKHLSNSEWNNVFFDKIKTNLKDNILYTNSISCGMLFSEICHNFKLNGGYDSGKLMGMSSYGKITDKNNWVNTINNFPYINYECIDNFKNKKYLSFDDQANLAKKVQHETKEYTIKLIKKSIELTKSNNIILSGGYFMNCVNNYEYLKAFPNINFYVDPICYDGGTAIGVSYFTNNILNSPFKIEPINTLYLGG
jgi:carbamoyltransferase